jgi:hypothetical protein
VAGLGVTPGRRGFLVSDSRSLGSQLAAVVSRPNSAFGSKRPRRALAHPRYNRASACKKAARGCGPARPKVCFAGFTDSDQPPMPPGLIIQYYTNAFQQTEVLSRCRWKLLRF